MDRATLSQRCAAGEKFTYVFFWGYSVPKDGSVTKTCFSQWYPASFEIDGIRYATAEHWMMAAKARLFDDKMSLEQILIAETPAAAKALGRLVKDFDDKTWKANARRLVTEGNVAKFSQNKALGDFLFATGDAVLVEASPRDCIWGIGLRQDNPKAQHPDTWRGQNLLGFALMDVRNQIMQHDISQLQEKLYQAHIDITRQGTHSINRWMHENPTSRLNLERADLPCANLTNARLAESNFNHANLAGAMLAGADCASANLAGADLSGANLAGAILTNANLFAAELGGANLYQADLSYANLTSANLNHANLSCANLYRSLLAESNLHETEFTKAQIGRTIFTSVDLSSCINLDYVFHDGPSSIDVETLYISRKIPEVFLRGCGVPDSLITSLPSLIGAEQPVQYYSCFISYSQQDQDFAKRLHSRMRDEKLRVWFAPEDMLAGCKLIEQIESAIQIHDKLLIVLSSNSIRSSWVKTEISKAARREKQEDRKILFPLGLVPFEDFKTWQAFDADLGTDLAAEIRSYYIPDFSNWKNHDAFESEFQRLLAALKADAE